MVCFKMSDLKRTKSYATLCVNIEFKNSKERSKANRLLEFDTDLTWIEVLEDTLAMGNDSLKKTDTVDVSLASKVSADTFHPPLDDVIDAALCFDKTLKYVTFKITPIDMNSETDINSNIHEKPKPTTPLASAFKVMMGSARPGPSKLALKLPPSKEPVYRGDALQGVVFIRLQLSCSSKIEFPYYAAVAMKKDLCCYCAAEGTLPNPNLLRDYKVVLPVCERCRAEGKELVKRNLKKT